MSSAEMDRKLGLKERMRKVANNLRKFGMLEGETAKLSVYHLQIMNDGLKYIAEKGIRNYSRELGDKHSVSFQTIKSDYTIMKRYGIIKP